MKHRQTEPLFCMLSIMKQFLLKFTFAVFWVGLGEAKLPKWQTPTQTIYCVSSEVHESIFKTTICFFHLDAFLPKAPKPNLTGNSSAITSRIFNSKCTNGSIVMTYRQALTTFTSKKQGCCKSTMNTIDANRQIRFRGFTSIL